LVLAPAEGWSRAWFLSARHAQFEAERRRLGELQPSRVTRLRGEEEWARRCASAELRVDVHQHDDGSRPAMHDLEAVLNGDRRAAIEVTAAVDADATELWNIVNGPGRWIEADLTGGWTVTVATNARQLRRDLPPFLLALARASVTRFPSHSHPAHRPIIAAPTGVLRASQGGTDFPGSIYVMLDLPQDQVSGYAQSTGDAVAVWVADFLRAPEREDVRTKLARSGAEERHAFVIVTGLAGVPFAVTDLLLRDDPPLPTVPPDLPSEVSDAWVVSTWGRGSGLRWDSRAQAWKHFSKGL
jgi:hypothetical protein